MKRRVAIGLFGGLALSSACWWSIASADPAVGPAAKPATPVAPAKALPPNKILAPVNVAVDNFYVEAYPEIGDNAKIELHLRNNGQVRVENVPWAIYELPSNRVVAEGVHAAIEPGQRATSNGTWLARPGSWTFQGYVDPKGSLKNTSSSLMRSSVAKVPVPGKHYVRIGLQGTGKGRVEDGIVFNCANTNVAGETPGNDCVKELPAGTRVRLTASPGRNSTWQGWGIGCQRDSSDNKKCTIVSGPRALAAAAFGL